MVDFAGYEIEVGKIYIPLSGVYKGFKGVCSNIKTTLSIGERDRVVLVIGAGTFKTYYPSQIVKARINND